ncbi:pyridoxamine 5'-phosphate oxidase family protein [Streptomyces sp. NPDC059477]|uniref:pyridoxamine 5'-phosphate oxidase family protein n=1 Tax=Streptomyces sp. NPDC059477 TaxID=3346847 RepID=UPI0036B38ECF
MSRYAEIAFTESVRRVQKEQGSARATARMLDDVPERDQLGPREVEFITSSDGFYLASASDSGWPYIQYRGGPPGFVRAQDGGTLSFADVRGNRQYISVGNLMRNDRVSLFFMDYASRSRLKLFGRATVGDPIEADGDGPRTEGVVERVITVQVEGFNWNCHQHITPRFTEAEISQYLSATHVRLAELEEENRRLRSQLARES